MSKMSRPKKESCSSLPVATIPIEKNHRMKELTLPDQPESLLATKRLLLRPMQAADLDALLLIFTDPQVMAAFDVEPFDRGRMSRWLGRNLDHQEQYGYGLFSVLLKENGLLIGDCGLEVMEVDGLQVAELGYDFRSDYWNQGYATEAASAVRDYAFDILGLPQLISLIRVKNTASQRVAEKIGMERISEFSRYGSQYWKYGLSCAALREK
jgi:ribosomal-protein-alanine N-acetyltransferase